MSTEQSGWPEQDGKLTAALAGVGAEPDGKPPVICLCGSLRFHDLLAGFRSKLTLEGAIVLGPEPVGHRATDPSVRSLLDRLHRVRIDMADSVLVVTDAEGYYGAHTRDEIRYAADHRVPVEFVCPAAKRRALDEGLLPVPIGGEA